MSLAIYLIVSNRQKTTNQQLIEKKRFSSIKELSKNDKPNYLDLHHLGNCDVYNIKRRPTK